MKKTRIMPVLIIFLFSCSSISTRKADDNKTVEIQKIILEIQSALAVANDEIERTTNLEFVSATLVLNTEARKSADGNAEYLVFSGKASGEKKNTEKVSIKLKPVKRQKTAGSFEKTISKRLSGLIVSAAEGVSNAGEGKYPMYVESLIIEMGIMVKTAVSIDADIDFELIPLSAGIGADYSDTDTNTLKIEFIKKK